MGKPKKVERFPVSVVIDGVTYTGVQVITGTRPLFHHVEFEGRTKVDNYAYPPDQIAYIRLMGEQLLRELLVKL